MSIVKELRTKKSRDNRELLDRAADRIEELENEHWKTLKKIFIDVELLIHANEIQTATGTYYRKELKDSLDILKKLYIAKGANASTNTEKGKLLLIDENKSNNFDVKSNNEIEEMARILCENGCKECIQTLCADWYKAERLYNAGYRKQSEGEWNDNIIGFCNVCMNCGAIVERSAIKNNSGKLNVCPNCGAKMKGGEG